MKHERFEAAQASAVNQVLFLPYLDVQKGRSTITVPHGATIYEMVAVALAGLPECAHSRVRVSIGEWVILPKHWHIVRPQPGFNVIIRVVPQSGDLRSILNVAVLVAAVALGQFYAPAIAGLAVPAGFAATAGTISIVSSLTTAAVALTGPLLLNAFIPARGLGDQDKGTSIYGITGLQNSSNPGGVIPSLLGYHRYAPPYAATSYTEIIGDDQYVIALFNFGHGPLNFYNHKLGETPISEFSGVEMQVRQGYPGDDPITLYPQQVFEEQMSVELKRTAGSIVRIGPKDITEMSIDISFVQGLFWVDDGGEYREQSVSILIEQRKVGDPDWSTVQSISMSAHEAKIIRRTFRWAVPTRGQYEIRVTKTSPDESGTAVERMDLSAVRGFRPEAPINYDKPLALVALRIRASNQLNNIVNNYNAEVALLCRDWDAATSSWIVRETSNPAALVRHVLQGPANAYPKADADIDLEGLQDWHEFCVSKGLTYNRIHDYDANRRDVINDIAAAGRATSRDTGSAWGVTIDRPSSSYVSAISPRNSWNIEGSTPYAVFPDAYKVQFIDATNGWQQAERIVPFPGVSPDDVVVTEDLPLPGITNPDTIWRETRRRQHELFHRPHSYSAEQDLESMVLARGDQVTFNSDLIDRDQVAARVRAVEGQTVYLDTPVLMETGRAYACVFRSSDGESVRRTIETTPGETQSLRTVGDISMVDPGDLASFGTAVRGPVIDVIVKSIERGENLTAKITFVDAAPIIDQLTDAEIPPAWNGRVGDVIDATALVPDAPIISSVSYFDGKLIVAVVPGPASAAVVGSITVAHRLHGGGAFTNISMPPSQGSVAISGYLSSDTVDLKAHAVSIYGVAGPETLETNGGALYFGSGPTLMSPGTFYLNDVAAYPSEASAKRTMASAKTMSSLSVSCSTAPGSGQSFTYTLRKNGADTALTCAISGASATTASDMSHSVSFAPGDELSLKVVVSASALSASHTASVAAA